MPKKPINAMGVRLENNLPRPVGGDGNQMVSIGDAEIEIVWKGGEVVDLISSKPPLMQMRATMMDESIPQMQEAIACYKCWVNDQTGDWVCLPTAC